MLNKDNIRELAYIVKVDEVRPIPGRDRVECAVVGGWTCMVPKGEFTAGDLGVYFEIDSKCPAKEPFLFLEKRHYKIKTQKFAIKDENGNKLGQFWSQGLLLSFENFVIDGQKPEWLINLRNYSQKEILNSDLRFLTKELEVKYAEVEDNKRKGKGLDKYQKMAQRMGKKFSKQPYRWLMKRMWGKKLLFLFYGRKKDSRQWPAWVKKTDEERVQNMPWILKDKTEWIATEKLDGTSTTFTLRRKKGLIPKYEFFVCSRNVVFDKPDKKCFYNTNVYLEMAEKYDIENKLLDFLKNNPKLDYVTLQGETFGEGIQKRDYSLKEHCFAGFNLITSLDGRLNPIVAKEIMDKYDIPWVPIVDTHFILPDTVPELLDIATDKSVIDEGMREGLVFRSYCGEKSFKAVSNEFLAKYH